MIKVNYLFNTTSVRGWLHSLVYHSQGDLAFLSAIAPHTGITALRAAVALGGWLDIAPTESGVFRKISVHAEKCSAVVRHLPCGQSHIIIASNDVISPPPGNVVILGRSDDELEKNLFLVFDRLIDTPIKREWKAFLMETLEFEGVETLESYGGVRGISFSIDQEVMRKEIIKGIKRREIHI